MENRRNIMTSKNIYCQVYTLVECAVVKVKFINI